VEALVERIRERRLRPTRPSKAEQLRAALAEDTPQIIDEAAGEVDEIIQTVTRRVSPSEIRASREVLRARMSKNPPWWAGKTPAGKSNWEAHHIIPVEFQDHAVFDMLTSKSRWDHHNPLINGIELPTTLQASFDSGLPLHQVTDELIDEAVKKGRTALPEAGVMRDLAFHPVYSARVKGALDKMVKDGLLDDPVRLGQAVEALANNLRREIESGKWAVLF
jgi:hypothetical protein